MCHSIFSQLILKGVKQNVAEKAKVRGPQKTFPNPTAPKNQNRRTKTSLLMIRISYHQTKHGLTKSNRLLFCVRALKVQICKSYVCYKKYVSVPKKYQIFLSHSVFLRVSRPFKLIVFQLGYFYIFYRTSKMNVKSYMTLMSILLTEYDI